MKVHAGRQVKLCGKLVERSRLLAVAYDPQVNSVGYLRHRPDEDINPFCLDQVGDGEDNKAAFNVKLSPEIVAHVRVGPKAVGVDEVATKYEIGTCSLALKVLENELAHTDHFVIAT